MATKCEACADPRPDCMGAVVQGIGAKCAALAVQEFTKGQLVTVNLGGLHGRLGVVEFGAIDDRGSKRYSVRMGPAWRHFAQAEDLTRLTWPDDVIERVKAHMAAVWRVVL